MGYESLHYINFNKFIHNKLSLLTKFFLKIINFFAQFKYEK